VTEKYIIDKATIAFQIHRIKHLAATKRPKISIPSRPMHSDASKELVPQKISKNSLIDCAYCYYTLQNALVPTPSPCLHPRQHRRGTQDAVVTLMVQIDSWKRAGEKEKRHKDLAWKKKRRQTQRRNSVSTGLQKPPCPRCVRTKGRICFRWESEDIEGVSTVHGYQKMIDQCR